MTLKNLKDKLQCCDILVTGFLEREGIGVRYKTAFLHQVHQIEDYLDNTCIDHMVYIDILCTPRIYKISMNYSKKYLDQILILWISTGYSSHHYWLSSLARIRYDRELEIHRELIRIFGQIYSYQEQNLSIGLPNCNNSLSLSPLGKSAV